MLQNTPKEIAIKKTVLMKTKIFLLTLSTILIFSSCKKQVDEPLPSYDSRVVPYKIIDETFKVGSRLSVVGNDNRVIRSITLPKRALYWCYWVGVGDEPVNELAKVIIPAVASKYTSDPFIAFGWKFISALNALKTTGGNIDLYFCDYNNKLLFENEDSNFTPYPFFQCPQAITSYAIRETMEQPYLRDSTFYATFRNMHPISGENVTFKVWAYIIKE
jgi:hypothetical protein